MFPSSEVHSCLKFNSPLKAQESEFLTKLWFFSYLNFSHKKISHHMQILSLVDNGCWPDQSFTKPSGLEGPHLPPSPCRALIHVLWHLPARDLDLVPREGLAASENKIESRVEAQPGGQRGGWFPWKTDVSTQLWAYTLAVYLAAWHGMLQELFTDRL